MSSYQVELYIPHDAQLQFHQCKARYICMNCGRRFGKTIAAANEGCKFACENPDTLTWWVAPTYRQARIAYRQMKKALEPLLLHHSDSELRLELVNGARIECRSADNPDNLRGEGVHMLIVEEAAMLPAKVWYEILRPMLSDTNGRAVFISTPKGRNWFYVIFMRGLDPEYPDYASFTFPTSANPHVPAKEIEDAKRDLPEDTFRQEYMAEFLEESAGVFRGIDACIYNPTQDEKEYIPGNLYTLGWDPAKHQDFSVMTVMNASTMRVVEWYRTNKVDYTYQLGELERMAHQYSAYILMDCTGVGDPLLERAKQMGLAADGYLFNNASKKNLVEHLQIGIQHRSLQFPEIDILLGELRIFEYKLSPSRLVTYGAPDGAHDDAVISLALSYFAAAKPNVPLAGDELVRTTGQEYVTIEKIEKIDPFEWAKDHFSWGEDN